VPNNKFGVIKLRYYEKDWSARLSSSQAGPPSAYLSLINCGGTRTPPARTPPGSTSHLNLWRSLRIVLPLHVLPPHFVEDSMWRAPPARTPPESTPHLNLWKNLRVVLPQHVLPPQFMEELNVGVLPRTYFPHVLGYTPQIEGGSTP